MVEKTSLPYVSPSWQAHSVQEGEIGERKEGRRKGGREKERETERRDEGPNIPFKLTSTVI
jgi:hypothetical protein